MDARKIILTKCGAMPVDGSRSFGAGVGQRVRPGLDTGRYAIQSGLEGRGWKWAPPKPMKMMGGGGTI